MLYTVCSGVGQVSWGSFFLKLSVVFKRLKNLVLGVFQFTDSKSDEEG